ncbi:EF-P lysine aminoacylase EpmA [Insolitispirillum peregrinum]|uniref:EF-P lysine aminoacylase EpmA n=1 Tax=Insolitispirillum peregrinum TaxID=80876 RepID=UPI00360D4585
MSNSKTPSSLPWWHPDQVARRRPALEARARIVAAVRRFFTDQEFLEVETPCLQVSPGLEPHLQAFGTDLIDPYGEKRRLYLHTSPEFAMKKLLVGGLPRIFQIARVFRNNERSTTHHPEFAMLEWYRRGASYLDLMEDVEGLIAATAQAAGCPVPPCTRMTIAEAFQTYAGIDILATVDDPANPSPDPAALKAEARRIGVYVGENDSWDDAFFHISLDRIEPRLGEDGPVILYDWPASMAALSRRKADDPRVCERFEVYWKGVELANAFGELTDAAEQRRRFEHDMALKERLYGFRYPIDEEFLAALELGLPECAGIALGIDRLVMVLLGAERLEDVLWAEVAPVRAFSH